MAIVAQLIKMMLAVIPWHYTQTSSTAKKFPEATASYFPLAHLVLFIYRQACHVNSGSSLAEVCATVESLQSILSWVNLQTVVSNKCAEC